MCVRFVWLSIMIDVGRIGACWLVRHAAPLVKGTDALGRSTPVCISPPWRRLVGRSLRYRPENVRAWVAGLSTEVAV
jgi:hypothetical protein